MQIQQPQNLSTKLSELSLSPDQRERLDQILSEIKRRKVEERARDFVPIKPSDPNPFGIPSNDQWGMIMSEADERWGFGGNRACKTETAVQDANMFACGTHPVRSLIQVPPVKIRCCAPKWRDNVVGVLLEKFQEVVVRSQLRGGSWRKGWSEKDHKLYYKNGSWIQFKSYEEDVNTYGGIDLDAVYMDEHAPEAYYTENRARLTDRNGYFVGTMTPEEGLTWEEDHVLHPPQGLTIDHWFFDQRGNPYLNPEGVRKTVAKYQNTILFDTKIRGQFTPLSGRVIPQWNPKIHLVPDFDIPDSWPRVFCIDTHTRTPSAAMWAAWDTDGGLVVYRTAKKFLTIPEWQQYIVVQSAGEKISLWLLDQPGNGDGKDINNLESICNQFRDGHNALPMQLVKKSGDKGFTAGIYLLWDMFKVDPVSKQSKIRIFESCNYHIEHINGTPHGSLPWELNRYVYRKKQKADEENLREKVRHVNDHYIADLRYIAQCGQPRLNRPAVKSALENRW